MSVRSVRLSTPLPSIRLAVCRSLASLSFYLARHSHLSDFDTCPTFHALIFVSAVLKLPRPCPCPCPATTTNCQPLLTVGCVSHYRSCCCCCCCCSLPAEVVHLSIPEQPLHNFLYAFFSFSWQDLHLKWQQLQPLRLLCSVFLHALFGECWQGI